MKPNLGEKKISPEYDSKLSKDGKTSPVHRPVTKDKTVYSATHTTSPSPTTSKPTERLSPSHPSKLTQSQTAATSPSKEKQKPLQKQLSAEADDILIVELSAPAPETSKVSRTSDNPNQNGDVKALPNGSAKLPSGNFSAGSKVDSSVNRDIMNKPSSTESKNSRAVSSLSGIPDKPVSSFTGATNSPKQTRTTVAPAKSAVSSISAQESTTQKSSMVSPVSGKASSITNGVKSGGLPENHASLRRDESKPAGGKSLNTDSQHTSPEKHSAKKLNLEAGDKNQTNVKDIPPPQRFNSKGSVALKTESKAGNSNVTDSRPTSISKVENTSTPVKVSEVTTAPSAARGTSPKVSPSAPASTTRPANKSNENTSANPILPVSPKLSAPTNTKDTTQSSPKPSADPKTSGPMTTAQASPKVPAVSRAAGSTKSLNDIPSPSAARSAAKKHPEPSAGNDLMVSSQSTVYS